MGFLLGFRTPSNQEHFIRPIVIAVRYKLQQSPIPSMDRHRLIVGVDYGTTYSGSYRIVLRPSQVLT
jgi:hypothetical protein